MIVSNQNFAVLDLGTNTFHLLIVRKNESGWEEIYRKRVFVNIAEEGIQTIGANCYNRGIETIEAFHVKLSELEVKQVKVFGTAALRTASNGPAFQAEVKLKTGITIEIIDGQREAALIAKGTKTIVDITVGNYLIMDIGGGSVEFILVQNNQETYIESFPVGITALYNQFTHSEPITIEEEQSINDFLSQQLAPLEQKIKHLEIEALVGASGSYEVLEKILSGEIAKDTSSKFEIEDILEQINKISKQNLATRLENQHIPAQRAKLIVVAFLLMKFVIKLSTVKSVIISPYALKEGALIELMNLD